MESEVLLSYLLLGWFIFRNLVKCREVGGVLGGLKFVYIKVDLNLLGGVGYRFRRLD